MPTKLIIRLLDSLDEGKRHFDKRSVAAVVDLLNQLARANFDDAASLIRFHEALLFIRAHPANRSVLNLAEKQLRTFPLRIKKLQSEDVDLSPLDDPEVSGIAGTSVTSNFSFEIARWLARKQAARVAIDWDWFDDPDRMGTVASRFMPLLAEDAVVEANVPFRDWIRAGKGRQRELPWLVERFESLSLSEKAQGELYDSLKLHITWKPAVSASRTGMKLRGARIFFQDQPLISRRDVSISAELTAPPFPFRRLSPAEGTRMIDLARETSASRYRELHGFTYGDPRRVLHAHIGRGVDLFFNGVAADRRLPLRAYHSAMIFKNGIPVGYFEGLSLCERMESGFNFYYTFREGETAWIYARVLRLCRQLLGVTAFSIEPYQIGYENEEGIESGAFWFYRKLGFRPVKPELMKTTLAEEKKITQRKGYRTSSRVLRKLAEDHMILETGRQPGARDNWDRFHVRSIGLAVQRRMATSFDGDANKIRNASVEFIKDALGLDSNGWSAAELQALDDLALVLAMIPELSAWTSEEKAQAIAAIRSKAAPDEARYLHLLQRHTKLRAAIIELGSGQ